MNGVVLINPTETLGMQCNYTHLACTSRCKDINRYQDMRRKTNTWCIISLYHPRRMPAPMRSPCIRTLSGIDIVNVPPKGSQGTAVRGRECKECHYVHMVITC